MTKYERFLIKHNTFLDLKNQSQWLKQELDEVIEERIKEFAEYNNIDIDFVGQYCENFLNSKL